MNNIIAGFAGSQLPAEDVDIVLSNRECLRRALEDLYIEELTPFGVDRHFGNLLRGHSQLADLCVMRLGLR